MISHRISLTSMCLNIEVMRTKIPLLHKYGKLTIMGSPFVRGKYSRVIAKCDCGNTKEFKLYRLKNGCTKSCGCIKIETNKARTTHGLTHHPIYSVWRSMKSRCHNHKTPEFKDYGGRGIKVCDEWQEFLPFYEWAKDKWRKGLELDRFPNNNGNYEPTNCRFTTDEQNKRNRRSVKLTLDKANLIREMYKTNIYTQKQLADIFLISLNNVSAITLNKRWKNSKEVSSFSGETKLGENPKIEIKTLESFFNPKN